jgi:hypothetical protein
MVSANPILAFFTWITLLLPTGSFANSDQKRIADSLLVVRNYTIIISYCSLSVEKGWFIPLDMLDETLPAQYAQTDSTIRDLLTTLAYAEDDLNQLLIQNPRYFNAVKQAEALAGKGQRRQYYQLEKEKAEAIEQLSKTNGEYVKLRNICIKLQSAINRETLRRTAETYLKQKKALSVGWIPPTHQKLVMKQHAVRNANRLYKRANRSITKKTV